MAEVNAKVPAAVALRSVPASYKQNKMKECLSLQIKEKKSFSAKELSYNKWLEVVYQNVGKAGYGGSCFQSQHFTETEGGGSLRVLGQPGLHS